MRGSRRAHPCLHSIHLIFLLTERTHESAKHHRPGLGTTYELSAASAPAEVRDAVNHIIDQLDTGKARVAEKIDGHGWTTNG